MSNDRLTYQDLLQIVELVKASSQFSEFRLKVGDVEIEMKRQRAGTAPLRHRLGPRDPRCRMQRRVTRHRPAIRSIAC